MKITLTNHAKKRMQERAITLKEIKEVIEIPDYIINKGKKKEAYKK